MPMSPVAQALRNGLAIVSLACACLSASERAHASGPVERLRQVLVHPSAPGVVVVRYAVPDGASHGFLFSRDNGQTFAALCSEAVTPNAPEDDKIARISSLKVPGTAAVALDAAGHVLFSQTDGLWSDDGSGCSWSKDGTIGENWPYSLIVDPAQADALLAVVTSWSADRMEARAELMRRTGGTWSVVGALKAPAAQQRAIGSGLVASATASGTRLYATLTLSMGAQTAATPETFAIVTSEDGGKTWREVGPVPMQGNEQFALLGVDPNEPKRVLATVYRDSSADTLLISDDEGKTFRDYLTITETSGVAFGPDGRVYVGDAGDDSSAETMGGLWTAAKLGDELTKVGTTRAVDCLALEPGSSKLLVCQRKSFGRMDPTSGAYEELTALDKIESLLECPSFDSGAACQAQLNAGASWCCAGHYPFTPFCGQYDVTMASGRPVLCGLSGREYESDGADGGTSGSQDTGAGRDAGSPRLDAGASGTSKDAGTSGAKDSGTAGMNQEEDDDDAGSHDKGGCAVRARALGAESTGGALASLGVLFIALGHSLRRRGRR